MTDILILIRMGCLAIIFLGLLIVGSKLKWFSWEYFMGWDKQAFSNTKGIGKWLKVLYVTGFVLALTFIYEIFA
jgi:hypothetical protein